jgi:hypothetical protein
MKKVGATALVLREAGAVLLDPLTLVHAADEANIAIEAFPDIDALKLRCLP